MNIIQYWLQIPSPWRSVATGLLAGLLGTLAWAFLVASNIKHGSSVPWAVPIMAVVLYLWWRYFVKGNGAPHSTAVSRRLGARFNTVPDQLLVPALGAGMLGLLGVLLLQGVLGRLATLPHQQDLDPSKYPLLTMLLWITMSAVVAGVVEETSFRGYIQGGLERSVGLVWAIVLSGSLFGFAHFSHPEVGLVLLPYYVAVSAVYGGLAYATDSTVPSMILHVVGNGFSAFGLITQGRSEWQLAGAESPLIWESGMDSSFVTNAVFLLLVGVGTVLAYRALISAGRAARLSAGGREVESV